MGETMNITLGDSVTAKHPSPHEDSDSSDDVERPLVLKQVLADLLRLTEELGPTHLKVAEVWNSLGLIRLHMQRNVQAAVKCHQEALAIFRCNQESSTVDIAVTLNDLGRCYERLDYQQEALQTYEEAVAMICKDTSIQKTHTVVESLNRAVARLRRS